MPTGSLLKLILFLLDYRSQGLRGSVYPDIVDQLQREVRDEFITYLVHNQGAVITWVVK